MKDREDQIMEVFQELKSVLKKASVGALDSDDFRSSREITEIIEKVASLESRTKTVLGGRSLDNGWASSLPEQSQYPNFYRIGRVLYKEGLRQDGKSVYTQKLPRETFHTILGAIKSQGNSKFNPKQISESASCPSYQTYIALNVLQDMGLIDSPERGRYKLTRTAGSLDPESCWNQVDEREAH